MENKSLRILITGGGSGGHIFPLIAVAESLRAQAMRTGTPLDVRYFGDAGDYEILLGGRGIRVCHIVSSKWRRYLSFKNLLEPFRAGIGLMQSLWRIFWFMPDVAFSKGGPGALVILFVCRFYRIPVIIHESDTVPGLTSVVSGRFARIIELGFGDAAEYFKTMKGEKKVVGNPVRRELLDTALTQEKAKIEFQFDPAKPVLLVVGGSQGAEALNNFILEHSAILFSEFQVLHQTGAEHFASHKKNYEEMSASYSDAVKRNYRMTPFFVGNMNSALRAADLVVSRAGANAIAEIAALGKPSILIPIERSTNNHQSENAYAYEKAGACVVIEEENLLIGLFTESVKRITQNPATTQKMSEAAKQFYMPNAAEAIAEDIITTAAS